MITFDPICCRSTHLTDGILALGSGTPETSAASLFSKFLCFLFLRLLLLLFNLVLLLVCIVVVVGLLGLSFSMSLLLLLWLSLLLFFSSTITEAEPPLVFFRLGRDFLREDEVVVEVLEKEVVSVYSIVVVAMLCIGENTRIV